MFFAPIVDRLAGRGPEVWRIHFEALRQRAEGRDIILLTVGDPDQPSPPAIIEETVKSLKAGRTGYSPILGYPILRRAIAKRIMTRTGRTCSEDNIAVVPGTQAGLFCVLQCLVGNNDEVIVPEPMYATYEAVVGATGAKIVNIPLRPENGFHPDLEELSQAITEKTRVIWINTPHNPTGVVLNQDEIKAIAALCKKHNLWLVSDEVYEDLTYNKPHVSPWSLHDMADRTIVISSISKSHAMPGFRFGWVAGPTDLINHLFNLLLCMLYGGPPFIQDGALVAFLSDLPEVATMREEYRARFELLSGILANAPLCRVVLPEGGMFLLLDIRKTGLSSEEFARALLEREAVATLPCEGFGPSVAGHLRISLTVNQKTLAEAGHRIIRFFKTLEKDELCQIASVA